MNTQPSIPGTGQQTTVTLTAQERSTLALLLAAAVVIGVLVARGYTRSATWTKPTPVAASVALVLRPTESPMGKRYVLVEFGDYECSACRAVQQDLPGLLRPYHGLITLEFRNLPLSDIHPHAETAAILAESARLKGRFWSVHDFLYATPMCWNTLEYVRIHFRLSGHEYARASHYLRVDEECAAKLRVDATPTFFLVGPDGRVVRLASAYALSRVMSADKW